MTYARRAAAALLSAAAVVSGVATAPAYASDGPLRLSVTNVTRYADTLVGAHATYVVTAVGATGTVRVACDRPSGRTYPLGVTAVHCSATDGAGATARASFAIAVHLRSGRFAAPLVDHGLVQKGDPLQASFALYRADGRTPLADADARALLVARRGRLTTQKPGSAAVDASLTYDAASHRFRATLQTFSWTGGVDYVVRYRVLATSQAVVGSRSVRLGVRLGA
jgi:hypothetical protein